MTMTISPVHQDTRLVDTSTFQISDDEDESQYIHQKHTAIKEHSHEQHRHRQNYCHGHDHDHNHDHDHDHSHSQSHKCSHDGWKQYLPHGHSFHARLQSDRQSLLISCVMLISVFLLQLIAGYIAHSSVLRVEAIHSALDGATIILSLMAVSVAGKSASRRMPFGYARAEVLSALVSLIALGVMCVKLSAEAANRLWHYTNGTKATIHVEGKIVFIAEAIALCNNLTIALVLARNNTSLNIRALRAHVIADSLENVLVLIAGIIMWKIPSLGILDAALTPIIVTMIVYLNYGMVRETVSILMQATPQWIKMDELREQIMTVKNVVSISKLYVWILTAEKIVGACTVIVEDNIDFVESETIRKQVERILLKVGVTNITVQVCGSEDGLTGDEESDDCGDNTHLIRRDYTLVNTDDVV